MIDTQSLRSRIFWIVVLSLLVPAAAMCGLASQAHAQWTATILHPAGAGSSRVLGIGGDEQAGYAVVNGQYHAAFWTGSADSWVDLSPDGSGRSRAIGCTTGQQVGWAETPTYRRACYWSGSPESWVSLNPVGVVYSDARATDGAHQVGAAYVDINWNASLWSGTAQSWVNLNPLLSSWSEANGVEGDEQVGRARVSGVTRAVLWRGMADSWVDLHPAGADNATCSPAPIFSQQLVEFQPWLGSLASMIDRHATHRLRTAMADRPLVLLHGARQTGKATLVRALAENIDGARYVTFDDLTTLAAAQNDSPRFLNGIGGPVVLDELQRAPSTFLAIKAAVDRKREPGRFLLTGSAKVLLVPQVANSFAGRMEIATLWPFTQGESEGVPEGFIDAAFGSLPPVLAAGG